MLQWMRQIRLGWVVYFILAAALITVEAGFFLPEESPWKRYAALFWIVISVGFLVTTWGYGLSPFFDRTFWSSRHSTWYVAAFFVPASLIMVDLDGVTFNRINGEATMQLSDALGLFHQLNSLGIYTLAFLDGTYPDRQYALASLPTYFFGPSLITCRIGYALLYLGAYWSFLATLRRYLQSREAPEPLLLVSYAGMMVALAIYPLIAARQFEQITMPLASTFYFLAGALLFTTRRTPYSAFWIMWAFGFFPYCYTAAIASWGLALLILLYLAFRPGYRVAVIALIYGILALSLSLWMQYQHGLSGKLALGQDPRYTALDWTWRYLTGSRAVAGSDESIIPQPLVLGILLALYLSWRSRDYRFFVVCVWALATIAAALGFRGYCWRAPEADVSRAMGIMPPLSLGVVLCLAFHAKDWFMAELPRRIILVFLVISMVFMIGNSLTIPFLRREIRYDPVEFPTDYDEATYMISTMVNTPGLDPIQRVYIVPPLDFNAESSLNYFAPGSIIIRGNPPPGEKLPGTYIFSYRTDNPDDRNWIQDMPDLHPRPYLKVQRE